MLIKNCISFIIIGISLFSILMLFYSIKNRNKNICKCILIIDIIYIVYLFMCVVVLPDFLYLAFSLEFLVLELVSLISVILYIISFIICLIKIKNIKAKNKSSVSSKIKISMLAIILLPILIFFSSFLRERYLINNSDFVLVYSSSGNGGLGDSRDFAYAVSDDYCKEFSLGVDINGYKLEEFLPKKKIIKKINDVKNIDNYSIIIDEDDNYILIYKNNKLIHKKEFNSNYFNIDFERGFYLSS